MQCTVLPLPHVLHFSAVTVLDGYNMECMPEMTQSSTGHAETHSRGAQIASCAAGKVKWRYGTLL